jgi:hypothetical protein
LIWQFPQVVNKRNLKVLRGLASKEKYLVLLLFQQVLFFCVGEATSSRLAVKRKQRKSKERVGLGGGDYSCVVLLQVG